MFGIPEVLTFGFAAANKFWNPPIEGWVAAPNPLILGPEKKGEVAEELATAISHGITGVPTYVINGQWSIPGAQDSETFERVLRRTAERMAT